MTLSPAVNEIYVPIGILHVHACVEHTPYQEDWDEGGKYLRGNIYCC